MMLTRMLRFGVLGFGLLMATTCVAQDAGGGARTARISGGVMAGQILTKVAPVYPEDAKAQHISGAVVMRAVIGKDGAIEDLQAISGPEVLRESALTAVRQWTYKPYLLNGEPTEVDTTITVNYNLGGGPGAGGQLPPGTIRIGGGVLAGLIESKVPPRYPQDAKDARVEGSVVMEIVVGKDGAIESLRMISGPTELQAAAWDAVKQWRYKPYLLNGEPTRVQSTVTVNFRIG